MTVILSLFHYFLRKMGFLENLSYDTILVIQKHHSEPKLTKSDTGKFKGVRRS
jgi:hypothetical protein